jgi:polysaccharide export outer membrane protein
VPDRVNLVRGCLALLVGCLLTAPVAGADSSADTVGMDWSSVAEYRIVPGDVLHLNFGINPVGDRDIIRTAPVRPDGRITVFPIGDVIAAGLTPRDLQASLIKLLSSEMRDPRVTVEVAEFAGNVVHVLGQVNSPGAFKAGPYFTVLQAVAQAGGFKDDASRNSVLVFHRDGARTVRVTRLRLDRAIKSGDLSRDMAVGRFDIVYVPRNSIGNLDLFTRQLFSGPSMLLSSMLTGWELFNLDRVFVVAR